MGLVLAACETAIDTSAFFYSDETCGLDLAFRIAGARAAVSTLWPVEDLVAAFVVMVLPVWRYGYSLTPDYGVTGVQRHFRQGTWKRLLPSEEQLSKFPRDIRYPLAKHYEPLMALSDDRFCSEEAWAVFRCLGY
jgi:hypothetical protein